GESAPISSITRHGVVRVGDADDARDEWDIVLLETERVTPAVPALVMEIDAGNDWLEKLDRIENLFAVGRVFLKRLILGGSELARFVQVHDATDLADVVHKRRVAHDFDLLFAESEAPREARRVERDAL